MNIPMDDPLLPIYQLSLRGQLDTQWSNWFDTMVVSQQGETGLGVVTITVTGPVRDQAALRGTLNRVWDLGLQLVSLTLVEPSS